MQPSNIPPDDEDHNTPNSTGRSIWWWLFVAPGTLFLWVQFMFPGKGDTWASGRRYRADHPVLKVLYSLGVWATIILVSLGLFISTRK